MQGYSQIAALLEKGTSIFLLLFGATIVMLIAGLIFIWLSQIGVFVKLSAAVGLIFDSAGSLETIFILLWKLIDLALIAVLLRSSHYRRIRAPLMISIILGQWARKRRAEVRSFGMMRSQRMNGNLISTVVGLSSIAVLSTAIQIAEAYKNRFGMQMFRLGIGVPARIACFSCDQPHHGVHGEDWC
ncbi:MAG: hypothetical protein VXX88_01325 [Pseudomonadota bacterium]|nr:hypothetical protein [Pseudomonadota bacterium]